MTPYPLFKGATRQPRVLGIPVVLAMAALQPIALIAITTNIFWWGLIVPVGAILQQLTKYDDRIFQIFTLYARTKLISRNTRFWGGVSCSPTEYRRRT